MQQFKVEKCSSLNYGSKSICIIQQPQRIMNPFILNKNEKLFLKINSTSKSIFHLSFILIAILSIYLFVLFYEGKNEMNIIEENKFMFTEEDLRKYDGSIPNRPIYISIKGVVFDVSKESVFYGIGASLNYFAGRDA